MNNTFSTKDLYLAALLYAKGIQFQKVERQTKLCWFVFENKSLCEEMQQRFFAKSVKVNAKEFVDAIRTLKDLLFSNK